MPIRPIRSIVFLLAILAALGISPAVADTLAAEFPKLAPYSAIRWEGEMPVVRIDDEWLALVSIDRLPVSEIIASSRRTYGEKWQKRFEEDLVEVLAGMGDEPKDTVRLVVRAPGAPSRRTLEDVAMTDSNRRAIYSANNEKEGVMDDDVEVSLAELVVRLRDEKNLVGLAAMIMVDGQVVDSAVDGERKIRSGVPLDIGDRWHLGSITKSITATMIARLVESGQMNWSDTVGESFPEAQIHDDWKPVTVRQLLTHTAGAPANFSFFVSFESPEMGPERTQARRDAVLGVVARKPAHPPGETFEYSNVGYTIAGAMAEQAASASWEDLVKREVFEPLGLTGSGFGPPTSGDKTLEQPRGHSPLLFWRLAASDDDDNTPIIGPAGTVHMTLHDMCAYATEHMRGDRGEGKLLSAETYNRLHTPEFENYACGWIKEEPDQIPHTMYWHNGSNTMWYAAIAFIPEKNMAVAVTSNDGDYISAETAALQIVKASVKQFEAPVIAPLP